MPTENLPTVINYDDPRMIATLKQTVAQGATNEEFAMFAELCKATGLNPFKKEVWFIKTKGYTKKDGTEVKPRVQIMTGLNGFLAIANRHPQYDGMECVVDRDKNGQPIRAIAKVYRKDRKYPAVAEALWSEYYKPNPYGNKGIWDQMGSVMLGKCAKSLALRESFPQEMNGLYTEEEMPREYAATVEPIAPKDPFLYDFSSAQLTDEQVTFLQSHCQWNEETNLWACTKDLGPKLAKYRARLANQKEASAKAESLKATIDEASENGWAEKMEDDLPESMGGPAEEDIPMSAKEEKIDHLKRIQERVRKDKTQKVA